MWPVRSLMLELNSFYSKEVCVHHKALHKFRIEAKMKEVDIKQADWGLLMESRLILRRVPGKARRIWYEFSSGSLYQGLLHPNNIFIILQIRFLILFLLKFSGRIIKIRHKANVDRGVAWWLIMKTVGQLTHNRSNIIKMALDDVGTIVGRLVRLFFPLSCLGGLKL